MSPKRIKAGAGPILFEWENWMKDENADLKRIKNIIDSWIIDIETDAHADITENEMQTFFKTMRGYGHLAKLSKDEEYLEKYKKIKQFYERRWGGPSIRVA